MQHVRRSLISFAAVLVTACGSEPSQGSQPMSIRPMPSVTIPIAAASGGSVATGGSGSVAIAAAIGGSMAAVVTGGAGVGVSGSPSITEAGSAGRAGSGSGSGSSGMGGIAAGPASFTRVWSEILSPKGCAGAYCHGGGQGNLKFSSKADAYKALVGVMAAGGPCGSSGKQRIKPGDPAGSLLLEKMEQTKPSCGDPMPTVATLCTHIR